MFKLSKVTGLQSAALLKMNCFTGSFKLSEWLYSYHHISYPIIQSTPQFQLRGKENTLFLSITPLLLYLYHSVTTWFFVDFSCASVMSVPRQPRLCLQLNWEAYSNWNSINELSFLIFSKPTLLKWLLICSKIQVINCIKRKIVKNIHLHWG